MIIRWALFILACSSTIAVAAGAHFSLVGVGIVALMVLGYDSYFRNHELQKVKAECEKISEAFGILQKNQLSLTTMNKRLEDKLEAVAQGNPVSVRMRPK